MALCVFAMGAAPAANAQEALSDGCAALNGPVYDGSYAANSLTAEFFAGEHIVASGGPPYIPVPPVELQLSVDAVLQDQGGVPGTVEYTFPAAGTYSVGWQVFGFGFPFWTVSCDPAPDADADADGVPDGEDNCPDVPNEDQTNTDGDSLGDACDGDIDGDGVVNEGDNCVFDANPLQEDRDHDGIGAACEETAEVPNADCSEPVSGTGGPDTRVLTGGDDAFDGLGGNDNLLGKGGHDCLLGSGGNDTLSGDAGNDTLSGGSGGDNLLGDDGRDDLTGGAGSDVVSGGAGADVIDVFDGAGGDRVVCGAGNDTVYADWLDTVGSDCEQVVRAPRGVPHQ